MEYVRLRRQSNTKEVAMRAFYFANHTTIGLTSSDGRRLVGAIGDLEPGDYLVFAKADIGVNVASGYPPPPSPYGVGALTLSFGGTSDVSYVGVVPESGQNGENIELMVAAQNDNQRKSALLYFQAASALKMFVNSVRLAVLQLDELTITEEGEAPPDVTEEANNARASLIKGAMTDVASARLFTSLLRRHDND
jgi:hypothetical protein